MAGIIRLGMRFFNGLQKTLAEHFEAGLDVNESHQVAQARQEGSPNQIKPVIEEL